MSAAAVSQTKRRRPVALWSPALVASARKAALHLHDGRPKSWWERQPDGFIERRITVRRVTCAECGRAILKGTLALYGFSGDAGRTPHPRYLCLEPCSVSCPDCRFYPCKCAVMSRMSHAPQVVSPSMLARMGRARPETLTLEEIREVCELALRQMQRKVGAA